MISTHLSRYLKEVPKNKNSFDGSIPGVADGRHLDFQNDRHLILFLKHIT